MNLYQISYNYTDPITGENDIRYTYCHADSIEEVEERLKNVPVDALLPGGETMEVTDYIEIKKCLTGV